MARLVELRADHREEALTATAPISWHELLVTSRAKGQLPVVVPTGSAPLIGYFQPNQNVAMEFGMAVLNHDAYVRVHAIAVALMTTRAQQGMDW